MAQRSTTFVSMLAAFALHVAGAARAQDVSADAGVPSTPPAAVPPPADADLTSTPPAPATAPTPAMSESEQAEVTRELAEIAEQSPRAGTAPSPPHAPAAAHTGNAFNPAISASVVTLGGGSDRRDAEIEDDLLSGVQLQEVEVRLSATVDPYFRADVRLAGNLDEIGFEEAYLATLAIPHITVRAGQIAANVGRHNLLHTHAYPFLTAPLPWRALLGAEGLRDPGVSADVLLPLPFFMELNAQVFGGEFGWLEGEVADDPDTGADESVPDRRRPEDLAYVAHLKMLHELGVSTTAELGGTYLGGRNGFGAWSSAVSADLTFKWRPIEAERYRGLDFTAEYLWVERKDAPAGEHEGGAYAALRWQFARRWWLQGRGAVLGVPEGERDRSYRGEALAAFIPSEFSALRLQYALQTPAASFEPVHELYLQAIVSIGPHPAHEY